MLGSFTSFYAQRASSPTTINSSNLVVCEYCGLTYNNVINKNTHQIYYCMGRDLSLEKSLLRIRNTMNMSIMANKSNSNLNAYSNSNFKYPVYSRSDQNFNFLSAFHNNNDENDNNNDDDDDDVSTRTTKTSKSDVLAPTPHTTPTNKTPTKYMDLLKGRTPNISRSSGTNKSAAAPNNVASKTPSKLARLSFDHKRDDSSKLKNNYELVVSAAATPKAPTRYSDALRGRVNSFKASKSDIAPTTYTKLPNIESRPTKSSHPKLFVNSKYTPKSSAKKIMSSEESFEVGGGKTPRPFLPPPPPPHPASNFKVHVIRLRPNQDLNAELDKFVREKNLKAAFIMTCVGSLTKATIRMAYSGQENNEVKIFKEHMEIVSLVGTLSSTGGHHLHISLSNKDGEVFGGHVFGELNIFTTAEVVIGECLDLNFTREFDNQSGFDELVVNRNSNEYY